MEWFAVIAGVSSMAGCVISIWQAHKSKQSADRAEGYKKAIFSKKVILDISDVIQKLTEVELVLKEYLRCEESNEEPRGRDRDKDARMYDEALTLLNQKIPLLQKEIKSKIDKYYKQLAKSTSFENIKSNLDDIGRVLRYLSEYQTNTTFEYNKYCLLELDNNQLKASYLPRFSVF